MRVKYSDISKTGNNLKDIDSVLESIDNILSTRIGERPFLREFGSRIEDLLFHPMTFSTSRLILSELIASISKWDKRVTILPSTTVTMDPDNRRYNILLNIQIKGLNTPMEISKSLLVKGV